MQRFRLHLSARLNEIVFLFANHENGTRRGARYAFGGAAEREMFGSREAMRSDHDKIDIELFGRFDDFVRRNSSANY